MIFVAYMQGKLRSARIQIQIKKKMSVKNITYHLMYKYFSAGDSEMIELLLARGAYVDPIADEIGTPLHLATKEQKVGAMKTLLDHSADVSLTSCYFCLNLHIQL
jgi:ankyrin repeat protein